jgi:hypothetical protein
MSPRIIVECERPLCPGLCGGTLSTCSKVDQIHCGREGVFCTMCMPTKPTVFWEHVPVSLSITHAWRCAQRETLTIAGFALDGSKWDGLYVGRRKGKDLIYAGKVDHGFDKVFSADLRKRLEPLVRKSQPYSKRIAHKGIWVEPKLLARSSTARSRRRGKSDTRSSEACARTYDGCLGSEPRNPLRVR